MNPPTYTSTETQEETTYHTTVIDYAESSQTTPLFDEGEVTQQPDRYFINNHPELRLQYDFQQDQESIDEDHVESEIVITGIGQSTRGNEVFKRHDLTENTDLYSYSDSTISINIEEFRTYQEEVSSELPRNSQVVLQVDRDVTTTDSQFGEITFTDSTEIQFSDDRTYVVTTEDNSERFTETTSVEKPQPTQTFEFYGEHLYTTGVAIISVGVFFTILVIYLLYRRSTNDKTVEQLRYEYELDKYESWITSGHPYEEPSLSSDASQLISVDSLRGLVEIAIDNNTRVVHSEGLGRFYVYDEPVIYSYTSPGFEGGFFIGPDEAVPNMRDFTPGDMESDVDWESLDDEDTFGGVSEDESDNSEEEDDESNGE